LKYPLIFYELKRFQKQIKRSIFGDLFCEKKKNLKSILGILGGDSDFFKNNDNFNSTFSSEENAMLITTKNIITDIYHLTLSWEKKSDRNENYYENENENNFGDFKMYKNLRQTSKLSTIPFSIEKNKFVDENKYIDVGVQEYMKRNEKLLKKNENFVKNNEVTTVLAVKCGKEVEEYRAASLQLARYVLTGLNCVKDICVHIYTYESIYTRIYIYVYTFIYMYIEKLMVQ
jgi:hypothetical protein